MERLTERTPDGFIRYNSRQGVSVLGQLARYEDTGLTPEEIMDGKLLAGWISVEERLPKPETPVFICATRKFSNGRKTQIRSLAMYEDGKITTTNSDFGWENANFEYDDPYNYFVPEGWWEYTVYSEYFSAVDDFVTHWMPMPEPPKGEE